MTIDITTMSTELNTMFSEVKKLNDAVEEMFDRFGKSVINEFYPGNTITYEEKMDILIGFFDWLETNHPEYPLARMGAVLNKEPHMGLESLVLIFGMTPSEDGMLMNVAASLSTFHQYLNDYLKEMNEELG